ncbi:hypothetical protein LUZ60_003004 [Juncus effusus]|nr:hypothetical protein LUZ60_003004 [Juncus effusus]
MGKPKLATADKEILVEIVRLTQKLKLNGSEGGWKDFLVRNDRKLGTSVSDPARRTKEILMAFLSTFPSETQKYFDNMVRRIVERKGLDLHLRKFPESESPELKLVRMTAEHSDYSRNFSFQSYNNDWKVMPIGKASKVINSKSLIAIDCEMVSCKDGTEALVRVCAVNRNLEVKLDTLVNPNKPIDDYRTNITDISAEDLEEVTVSLSDVQKLLKKILKKGTIVIGHSLHFDLLALKIDYPLVIDTTNIFKYSDLPLGASPSLNNLCKTILGKAVREDREPHNCLNDAKAAMQIVLQKLEKGYNEPLQVSSIYVSESDLAKLLVHRVPLCVPHQNLRNVFPGNPKIDTNIRMKGRFYSTYVEFGNCREADEAFHALDGVEEEDKIGRPQKLVVCKHDNKPVGIICVRKMVRESSNKRQLSLENEETINTHESSHKKLKMCCEHEREVERLKRELREREDEIFRLQKELDSAPKLSGIMKNFRAINSISN